SSGFPSSSAGHAPVHQQPKKKAAAHPTGHPSKSSFHPAAKAKTAKPAAKPAAAKHTAQPATTTKAGGPMPTLPAGTKASQKLANAGMARAAGHKSGSRCAAGVADAIAKATGSSPRNNANKLGSELVRSGKFKEVKGMSLQDALKI